MIHEGKTRGKREMKRRMTIRTRTRADSNRSTSGRERRRIQGRGKGSQDWVLTCHSEIPSVRPFHSLDLLLFRLPCI
jgi:hypothetical protein